MRWIWVVLVSASAFLTSTSVHAAPDELAMPSDIDLSEPFAAPSAWHLSATQGPSVPDDFGDPSPGEVNICLHRGAAGPCSPQLQSPLRLPLQGDIYDQPRYLNKVDVVHGASNRPYLLVQTGSMYSINGNQLVFTQVLAYRPDNDEFERVYNYQSGRNNNQKIHFIEKGILQGTIISVEPTENAPFGYWVVVNTASSDDSYKEVLRYRSATTYADGNPLSVIDSEMANIQQRLGLWKPGTPLPLPDSPCPKPHLIRMELWCK